MLQRLLTHPRANAFDVTALVRSPEKAKLLKSRFPQVKVAVGHHGESDKIASLAEKAHLVLQIVGLASLLSTLPHSRLTARQADSDDEALIKALLKGLRKRYETTGDVATFIHTVSAREYSTEEIDLIL